MRAKHRASRRVGRLTKYNTLTGNTWGVLSPVFTRNHPPGTRGAHRARCRVTAGFLVAHRLVQRREALTLFGENLARSFYGFEPDFFQQNVTRIVDDVVSVIHASLELWPTLVEICYFHKDKKDFPQVRVKNKRIKGRNGAAA